MDAEKKAKEELENEMKELGLDPTYPPVTDNEEEEKDKETPSKKPDEEPSDSKDDEESKGRTPIKPKDEDDESSNKEDDEEEEDDDQGKLIPEYKVKRRIKNQVEEATKPLLDSIKTLTDEVNKLKGGTNHKTAPVVNEKIKEVANKIGITDVDNLQALVDVIVEQAKESGKVDPKLQEEVEGLKKALGDQKEREAIEEDKKYFENSWNTFLPDFQKSFPKASAEEIAKAKAKMDEIWHTKKWANFDIDYVFFKNRDEFDSVVSPRRKGIETGKSQGHVSIKGKKLTLSDNPSETELREAEKAIAEIASDDKGLKPVTNR